MVTSIVKLPQSLPYAPSIALTLMIAALSFLFIRLSLIFLWMTLCVCAMTYSLILFAADALPTRDYLAAIYLRNFDCLTDINFELLHVCIIYLKSSEPMNVFDMPPSSYDVLSNLSLLVSYTALP